MKTLITALVLSLAATALAQVPTMDDPSADPAAADPATATDPATAADPAAATATATATAEVSVSASADAKAPSSGFALGLAPRVGMTVPTSDLGVFIVGGLEIDLFLPIARRRLVLALDATFTRPSHDGSGTDPRTGDYNFTVKELEVKLGLDVIFRFFTDDKKLVPFAGIGPIVHLLETTQTNDLAPGENTEQSTEFGVELLGGIDYKVGPGALLGEARFVYSGLDHLMTGDSNAGNITLSVGYRYVF